MSVKVKRGLGLLVVAAIALLVALPLLQADAPNNEAAEVAMLVLMLVVGLGFWISLVAGLALLAWGLLRD